KSSLALLVSSICYEVFGIIIIEAFAQRTPVIVNNLGALPEVVQQSGGGYVYNND
ncbi:MAG: glycosyltransferase, partial [Nitrosopumilaceae archaeon]|nr:glycosyltransferase family 4 protein [Nitrosopumilaceae archaeon]NIU87730.1 glycosyltransferase [Nitrosopumilaceae archaeon]NIX60284.1 glycosyltransferase [Nitrosopumilaceae archaeon]